MKRVVTTALLLAVVAACGDDGGDLDAFCRGATEAGQLDAVFDTFDPSDVEGTAEQFEAAREAYEALEADAPPEVRDDLGVLIDFTTDFRDALATGDPTDPATTTQVALDLEKRFTDVDTATKALDTFVEQQCPEP